jgi:hypothetical protein
MLRDTGPTWRSSPRWPRQPDQLPRGTACWRSRASGAIRPVHRAQLAFELSRGLPPLSRPVRPPAVRASSSSPSATSGCAPIALPVTGLPLTIGKGGWASMRPLSRRAFLASSAAAQSSPARRAALAEVRSKRPSRAACRRQRSPPTATPSPTLPPTATPTPIPSGSEERVLLAAPFRNAPCHSAQSARTGNDGPRRRPRERAWRLARRRRGCDLGAGGGQPLVLPRANVQASPSSAPSTDRRLEQVIPATRQSLLMGGWPTKSCRRAASSGSNCCWICMSRGRSTRSTRPTAAPAPSAKPSRRGLARCRPTSPSAWPRSRTRR